MHISHNFHLGTPEDSPLRKMEVQNILCRVCLEQTGHVTLYDMLSDMCIAHMPFLLFLLFFYDYSYTDCEALWF